MYKISVIIPAYNAEKWVERCVESVGLDHCDNEVECIIINDGSTDKTAEIVKGIVANQNHIRIYNISNMGVSNARNLGMSVARGTWITFLDSDDEFVPMWYREIKSSLAEKDLYIFSYLKRDVKGNLEKVNYSLKGNSGIEIDELLLTTPELNTCWAKLYRRSVIEKYDIKFRDELQYGEDFVFVLDYCSKVKNILISPSFLVIYNDNALSVMHAGSIEKRLEDNVTLLSSRLQYDIDRCNSIFRDKIFLHHFKALTHILLNISQRKQPVKEMLELYRTVEKHDYTKTVLKNVMFNQMSIIKKIEFLLISHVKFITPLYFGIKKIFL